MIARTGLTAALLAATGLAQGPKPVDFEHEVLPFLVAKCFNCHAAPEMQANGRMSEPKGGLRLDGKQWILRGGDGEDAVVPKDLELSGVFRRVALPATDSDFMPSKGDPLTEAETATLRRWIEEGASFGAWTGASADPADAAPPERAERRMLVPPRVERWAELAKGLSPLTERALAAAQGDGAQLIPVAPDSPLLRLSFRSYEADTDDAALAAMQGVAGRVTVAELGRTALTDRAARSIAKLERLTRIDLSQTAAGDDVAKALAELSHVTSINLRGTKVTDRGLAALQQAKALETLYVWGASISAAGVEAFRQARPEIRVVGAPKWPTPPPEPDNPQRRRRR